MPQGGGGTGVLVKILSMGICDGAPSTAHSSFLSCVCYAFVRICLFVPCGHLLGKGLPLGSRFVIVFDISN